MKKSISLVIPVYNEQERLEKTIAGVLSWKNYREIELEEIIFVNDGSRDKTLKLLNESKAIIEKDLKVEIKIISYSTNRGKGYAVGLGMRAAKGDYALLLDADMSTPVGEIKKIIPYIKEGRPVIIGTRKNGESTVRLAQPLHRQIMGRVFTLASHVILNTWVTDFTCGFKLFSREARAGIFDRSRIERWGYDAEILYIARKLGYDISEKALLWYNDERSRVSIVRDTVRTMSELMQIRLNSLFGRYDLPSSHAKLIGKAMAWAKLSQ